MKQAAELVNVLKNILGNPDAVFPATVAAVDKENNVCDVVYNEMEIGEVRLQAIIKAGTKGLKVYPAENSTVLVQRLGDKGEFFICMVSEIESVLMEADTTVMEVKDGFLFQKDAETLNKILNDLIDLCENIVVPTNSGPSGNPINKIGFEAIKTRVNNLLK
jgi:hypothetical protein